MGTGIWTSLKRRFCQNAKHRPQFSQQLKLGVVTPSECLEIVLVEQEWYEEHEKKIKRLRGQPESSHNG